MCILLVADLAFTALPCSSVASPGCSPSLLGTELTILRGRGAAYSKEVLATWTRANGIGSIGSNLSQLLADRCRSHAFELVELGEETLVGAGCLTTGERKLFLHNSTLRNVCW